jgi:hypothetical protein
LTPELAFPFYSSWNMVAHRRRQRPDVRLPFHHLKSDGFWSALAEDGKPSPDPRLTRSAALAADFVAICERNFKTASQSTSSVKAAADRHL